MLLELLEQPLVLGLEGEVQEAPHLDPASSYALLLPRISCVEI